MKRFMMAAALLLVALTANAEDTTQFRVGAAAAFTDYKGDPSYPVEDSSLGVQFYGQIALSKTFAVEVGFRRGLAASAVAVQAVANCEYEVLLVGQCSSCLGP